MSIKKWRKSIAKRLQNHLPVGKKRRRKQKSSTNRTFIIFLAGIVGLIFIIWLGQPRPMPITDERSFFEALAPSAQKYGDRYGLFPSVILAQAALESDFGRSELAHTYQNYFGIKSYGREKKVVLPTLEYLDGQWVTMEEPFRVYNGPDGSIHDYARLITGLDRYHGVLSATTPEDAAYALVAGGYATDPAYASKIILLIQSYQLKQYDQ